MKALLSDHFDKIMDLFVLVFVFVFATAMLAKYQNEEMSRWIENGAIIAILARMLGPRPLLAKPENGKPPEPKEEPKP